MYTCLEDSAGGTIGNRLWVTGGGIRAIFGAHDETSNAVHDFDAISEQWSRAPNIHGSAPLAHTAIPADG